MYSGQTRCWYARTIASETTYLGNKHFFDRIEQNTLTVLLFHEKLAIRKTLDCYSITKNEQEFNWVKSFLPQQVINHNVDNETLWVRRSCYEIGGKMPFYLVEIFLPGFLELLV